MNILKIVAIAAIIVCIAVAIIYVMGQIEATKPIYEQIMLATSDLQTAVTDNWQTITAGGGVAAAAGTAIGAANKISKVKDQLSNTVSTAQNQIGELTSKTENLTTVINEKEKLIQQFTTEKEALTGQINTAKTQAEEAKQQLQRQILANEEQAKLKIAEFESTLTGGSIVKDPLTGNIIKTVEKIVHK